MSSLSEIAKTIKETPENIILIYAFNGTGKTRLCVEYKELTKNDDRTGVYYNAYSEDLFVWDNDEENNNTQMKLSVKQSSLSKFHSFLIENRDLLNEKVAPYNPEYSFKLNAHENPEQGIESVTFSLEEDGAPIKISRGEERIFVWCFFLALFEVGDWTTEQGAHFFIDDPVSSLDDHNIFITAQSILNLIESQYNGGVLNKKIIITTHHIGLFSILSDRLKRGSKADKFKIKDGNGKFKSEVKQFILKRKNNEFELKSINDDIFLFHLHLMKTLKDAIDTQLYLFHFVLLRQLLENVASFIGSGSFGFILSEIKVDNPNDASAIINSLSHQDAYRFQFNAMSSEQEKLFKEIYNKLQDKYHFITH